MYEPNRSSCEADFAKLLKNALTFLKSGISKADEGLKILSGIFVSCSNLFEVQRFFITLAYAINPTEAKKNVNSFVDKFPSAANDFQNEFNRLDFINKEILRLVENFLKENDLTSKFSTMRGGCESRLNTLRRELSTTTSGTRANTADIDTAINYIGRNSITGLRNIVKKIEQVNNSSDNKEDFSKQKQDINKLFSEFFEIHWAGHVQAILVQDRLQKILYTLSPLFAKYDSSM